MRLSHAIPTALLAYGLGSASAAIVKLEFSSLNEDVVTHGFPVGTAIAAVLTYDSDEKNTLAMPFPTILTYANFPAIAFSVNVGGYIYEAIGPITITQAAGRGWFGVPSYGTQPSDFDFFMASAVAWSGPTLAGGYSLSEFMFQLKTPSYLLNGQDRDALNLRPDGPGEWAGAYFRGSFKSSKDSYEHLVYGYSGTSAVLQVPEPGSLALFAIALLSAATRTRSARRRTTAPSR